MKKSILFILLALMFTPVFGQILPDAEWETRYFVDEFGDYTDKGYMACNRISGKFSNSATTDSKLKIAFIVTNDGGADLYKTTGISIGVDFYEYAGNHKMKGDSEYSILVKYKKERVKLTAKQYSSRIYFDYENSKILNELLLKHNTLTFMFVQQPKYGSTSKYIFKVNAIGYTKVHNKFFNTAKSN